jgi:hypothetical protein
VLEADAGRALGAEVQLAKERQRGTGVFVVLDRPVERADPTAGDRAAVVTRVRDAGHGELVAVALVGDGAAGGAVHDLIGVESLIPVDPQPPMGAGEDELCAARIVVVLDQLH